MASRHIISKAIAINRRVISIPPITSVIGYRRYWLYDTNILKLRTILEGLQYCSITTDGWISILTVDSFITYTIHYINDKWELNENVLETVTFDISIE